MSLRENVTLALRTVRSNWLRAILTLLIIAFGIMALVGILTAIDVGINSLSENLSSLGANTFSIKPSGQGARGNRMGRREKRGEPITFDQAVSFKERYDFPARVAVSLRCTGTATVKHQDEKTNPNIGVYGIDENYLETAGYSLSQGRNFTQLEALRGGFIAIIGEELVAELFEGKPEKAIGKSLYAGSIKLKIVGTLQSKGTSMGGNDDRRVLIPLLTAKRYYGNDRSNYTLVVAVNDATKVEAGTDYAIGLFRNVRDLRTAEENDFEIAQSDNLISLIRENTTYFRWAAIGIGLITLLGAAIGLMNIMLVSVTERTREIGICKAIGAKQSTIRTQFLAEAVTISLIGGVVGIVLGVLAGNVVAVISGGSFLFPYGWVVLAIVTCTLVGLVSGLYPAVKAAQLDPIESLRYE